jgi:SAM-dependent methyltransferase
MTAQPTAPRPSPYVFDRSFSKEQERLAIQAEMLDPGTIRHMKALGFLSGWTCAEIGAGAGSIACWMADHVGHPGRVVATDVDTRFLEPLRRETLDIRKHDIVAGPLEENAYDFIHTRLLLMHLPQRARAIANMVASLRPGGWLLAEDYDLGTAGFFSPASELQVKVNEAVQGMFERTGGDPRHGIRLVGALTAAGLDEVQAEGRLQVVLLGSRTAEALALKLEQFRAALRKDDLLTEDEIDRAIAEIRSPGEGAVGYPPLMIAAWGRKPR